MIILKSLSHAHNLARLMKLVSFITFMMLSLNLWLPHQALAAGVVTQCGLYNTGSAFDLESALIGGGSVTFNCDGTNVPATIAIPSQIDLPTSGTLTIDGGNVITLQSSSINERIFRINGGTAAITITNIRLDKVNASTTDGGTIGILSGGSPTLTVISTTFSNNFAQRGSGINVDNAAAIVNISNSTFISNTATHNTSSQGGGAIRVNSALIVNITNTNFFSNQVTGTTGQNGGAIYINSATNIYNSTFSANKTTGASSDGGAIQSNATTNIYNSTFYTNTSINRGGAIYASAATNIYTSTFSDNRSPNGGGGIYANAATNIYNSTFTSNKTTAANTDGGAVYVNSTVNISNSTFSANNPTRNGGAIHVQGGTFNSYSNSFSGNIAGTNGGAVYINSTTNIYSNTFSSNTANAIGGGVYATLGTNNLYNSTFYGNSATTSGGGIAVNGGTVNIYHATLVNNSSATGGGFMRTGGTANMYNTLIATNTATTGPNCHATAAPGPTSAQGSLTNDITGNCSAQFGANTPGITFGILGNNGGSTQTVPLFAGSTAIDAANLTYCTSGFNTNIDQRGNTRVTQDIPNFGGSGTSSCDVGAYEFLLSDRPTASISDSSANEGTNAVITISLTAPISQNVVITYSTAATGTADGTDFTPQTNQTITILAGATSATINVTLLNDSNNEAGETFYVNLSAISPWATLLDNQGLVTIIDTSPVPILSVSADISSLTEPISTTDQSPITFTIQLNTASGQTVTVDYNLTASTAVNGLDYDGSGLPATTLTFSPGQISKTIVITAIGDNLADGNKTVSVGLSNASNANILVNQATTTIVDSDGNPQIYFVSDASANEGNLGSTALVFTVTSNIQPGPYNPITITYSTADGTATISDVDYTSSSNTVHITYASWPYTDNPIQVPIIGDLKTESNETFYVNISTSAPGVTVSDAQAIGTIINDDAPPSAYITNAALTGTTTLATEGNSGTTSMIFAVSLAQASSLPIAVNYTTVNSTAIAALDYTTKTGTVNFPAGTTGPQYIFIDGLGDTLDELNENFQVQLTGGTNVTILTTTNTATGTIIDDDTATVSIDSVTQDEGNVGTTSFIFNVALSTSSDRPITLTYQITGGTATPNVDYLAVPSATLTMTAGMTQAQITAIVTPDLTLEPDETFFVKIISATNATVTANTQGKGTILDDDPFSAIGISDVTVTEGVNAQAIFTVTLTPAVLVATTIDFSTADGTAKAGLDYQALSGTITIPAGTTQKTIAVNIINDSIKESTENFYLNLSNSTGPQISDPQGIATIIDNDTALSSTVSITNATLIEGDTGSKTMLFTVTLGATPGQTVIVDYNTMDNTAKAGSDYTSKSGFLTFPADGTTVQTFTVAILGDVLDELTEVFTVELSNPQNAVLGQATATGTIQDNDLTSVTMGNATVTEGDSGTTTATLLLALSLVSDHEVAVQYSTANGTATAGSDFIAQTGIVTFSPNITQQSISVAVLGDKLDELDETFRVDLSQPNQLTINTANSPITIKDDDATTISIGDVTITEGNSGITAASFTVLLSLMSDRAITVTYATASDTATASRPGVAVLNPDYMETQGIVTFAPMITSQVITVAILGDTFHEDDEGYYVNLTNNGEVSFTDNQAKGTILNDDDLLPEIPTVYITDTSVVERNSGLTNAVLTVTLSPPSQNPITVDYKLVNGTATMNSDYQGLSGTITFAAGETVQKITIPVIGDLISEIDETFSVNLEPTSQVEMGDGQGIVTIKNDDIVAISIEPAVTVQEGQAPNEAIFQVTLSNPSDRLVAVEYKTINGTAVAGSDFTGQNAFLSFDPGETAQTIHVAIINDSESESQEILTVELSNPNRAIIQEGESTATIRDDDGTPTLYLEAAEVTEGNSGTKMMRFNFTIWPTTTTAAQVDYSTADETSTAGTDYQATSGTLNITTNSTSAEISVPIIGDMLDEFDETFSLNLTSAVGITLANDKATGTIVDDDTAEVSMSDIFALNGPNGSGNAVFTVTLSLVSDHPITFTYQTQNGTGLNGQDFVGQTGVITIPAGATFQTITIPILDNNVPDPAKTFTLIVKNSQIVIEESATATILDDDGPARLYINDVTVTEGNSGVTAATFSVQLWPQTSQVVVVNYTAADGVVAGKNAKLSDNDYQATTGQLTFRPNNASLQTISVPVVGDLKVEVDEQFMVNLSNAIGADLGISQGMGTILNDDLNPLTISDSQTMEGNTDRHDMVFTVTLETASSLPVTVDYETVANTATANSDFESTSGTLTLAPGQTSATILVPIMGDTAIEGDESFFIQLSNPTNTSLVKSQAMGTIKNDDVKPIKLTYIPLIIKQPASTVTPTPTVVPGPADLVVQSITATNNLVEVTIKNVGGSTIPTSQAFWVEFYVNPNPVPNAVNQSWRGRASQGLVWRVSNPALPLAPNGTLTLVYSTAPGAANSYYVAAFSQFNGNLSAGTPLYAQVDSTNASTTYGVVLENHEVNGGAYNNVLGPVLVK